MTSLKTQAQPGAVPAFLASITDTQRQQECQVLDALFQKITGVEPVLWGTNIVGYGSYTYSRKGSKEIHHWFQTGFSPRKQAISIYLIGGIPKKEAQELGPHTAGVGCLYIKKLSDSNMRILEKMVRLSLAALKKQHAKE